MLHSDIFGYSKVFTNSCLVIHSNITRTTSLPISFNGKKKSHRTIDGIAFTNLFYIFFSIQFSEILRNEYAINSKLKYLKTCDNIHHFERMHFSQCVWCVPYTCQTKLSIVHGKISSYFMNKTIWNKCSLLQIWMWTRIHSECHLNVTWKLNSSRIRYNDSRRIFAWKSIWHSRL